MNAQIRFLLVDLGIPVVTALLIVIGRTSVRRTLLLVSGSAVALMLANLLVFALEYAQHAFSFGYLRRPTTGFVAFLDNTSQIIGTLGMFLVIVGWVIALFDSSRHRRWFWFSTILFGAVVSYVTSAIDINEAFLRELTFYDQLVVDHFLVVSIIVGSLPLLVATITILYAFRAGTFQELAS